MSVSSVTHQLCSQSHSDLSLRQPSHRIRSRAFVPTTTTGRAKASTARLLGRRGRSPNCGRTNIWQQSSQERTGWPLGPAIGPHLRPGLEDLDAARPPDWHPGVPAAPGRGMVQQPQPAAGQLNPVQPSAQRIRTSRCSASRRARAAATQSLGSTSSRALGGLVATKEAGLRRSVRLSGW
jgi:hypothetical protein